MVQVIRGKPTFGEMFGTGLSKGLSSGFNQLAEDKLKQYAANQERQRYTQAISPVLGQEAANFVANLGPEERKYALQNIGPIRELFGQKSGEQDNVGMQPSEEGGVLDQLTGQAERDKKFQDIFTPEATKLKREELDLRKKSEARKEREAQEAYDIKFREKVQPYIDTKSSALTDQRRIKHDAQNALKLLKANRSKWPGALMGNLPQVAQDVLIRDKDVREYMATVSRLVTLVSNSRKGVPSNYKTKLEELGKAGVGKPVETQEAILQDLIDVADKEIDSNKYLHSLKNKENDRYPLDLREEVDRFDLAQDAPLEYPGFYEEGTKFVDDNGTEYELKNGKWVEVK